MSQNQFSLSQSILTFFLSEVPTVLSARALPLVGNRYIPIGVFLEYPQAWPEQNWLRWGSRSRNVAFTQ